jgi:hypothetical protein
MELVLATLPTNSRGTESIILIPFDPFDSSLLQPSYARDDIHIPPSFIETITIIDIFLSRAAERSIAPL